MSRTKLTKNLRWKDKMDVNAFFDTNEHYLLALFVLM